MRVRAVVLRILAAALVGLWSALFVLVLLGYRPGGPIDALVGLATLPPVGIALAALVWPPVARGDRAFAAIAWLALAAILVLVPSIGEIATRLQAGGPQTLLPSFEATYPWALALLATGLFAGYGVARSQLGETAMRRRRLLRGTGLGIVAAWVAAATFAGAAVGNELAMRDRVTFGSRFGPTAGDLDLPACDGPLAVGATARLEGSLRLEVDGRRRGSLTFGGSRSGEAIRWTGYLATERELGTVGYAHLDATDWAFARGRWSRLAEPRVGWDLDRQVIATALVADQRAVAQMLGIAIVEGARARACRIAIDGGVVRDALPAVDWLVPGADLPRWRGELDFWVFADGQLGQVDLRINGSAADVAEDAVQATLFAHLIAVNRGVPVSIARPPG